MTMLAVVVVTVVMASMGVIPVLMHGDGDAIGLAGSRALQLTERATLRQTFHMVVVALLSTANVLFEAEHLSPVLTQGAIHRGIAANHFINTLLEGLHYLGVITQIPG